MLQTKRSPSSAVLRPYVCAYGMITGRVQSAPLLVPLPARPKQLLTFSFADRYRSLRPGSDQLEAAHRVTVVGPQTHARPGLTVFGQIDNFTIHFQPSGFHRLFGIPMTELTDAAYDAHAVIGAEFPSLEHELCETPGFAGRIQLIEDCLIRMLGCHGAPDPVALAANSLFASNGNQRVAAMASDCGLSPRQFERRFLAQVGVSPKLYGRIIRFTAAVHQKLRCPAHAWSRIANDQDYHDQMHMVHDFRAFTGESPSRFLPHIEGLPAFHRLFAVPNRVRHEKSRRVSHPYYPDGDAMD